MEYIDLKSNITIDNLKKLVGTKWDWSKNKYCKDPEKAAAAEQLFKDEAIAFHTNIKIERPTGSGFYATVIFNTKNKTAKTVVLRIPTDFCVLYYYPKIPYFGRGITVETALPHLCYWPKPIGEDEEADAVHSCEQIEKFIPDTDGTFKSGGPRRVAMFYYNTCLEGYLVQLSIEGKLKDLSISSFKALDKSHLYFKQGAGNYLPDLETTEGIKYEVKGPFAKPTNFLTDINKNKDAQYLLHYTYDKKLHLYEKTDDGSYTKQPTKSIQLDLDYPDVTAEYPDSWEEYKQIYDETTY